MCRTASVVVLILAVGCGHSRPAPPTDLGAIAAEDNVDRDDRNHDGVVDADEAAAALLDRVDHDRDGRISAAEAKTASGEDAATLGDFASRDADGDGYLTIGDLRALFASQIAATKEAPRAPATKPQNGHGGGRGRGHRGGAGGFGQR